MAGGTKPREAARLLRQDGRSRLILICDHATNHIPDDLGTLGLTASERERHIAWDIGAAALTERLSALLDAPALLAGFSRLVIDPNRGLEDPTLVPAFSDGTIIPGNCNLAPARLAERIARYYGPYHDAIAAAIARAENGGRSPVLLSLHSFTPVWKGAPRPWHMGVLWNRDGRFAQSLLARLRGEGDLVIGDNEPYSGALAGDCMDRHGTARGLPHALLEIRQDLLLAPGAIAALAARLAPLIRATLEGLGPSAGKETYP